MAPARAGAFVYAASSVGAAVSLRADQSKRP